MDIFVDDVFKDSIKNFEDNIDCENYCAAQLGVGVFEKNIDLGSGSKKIRVVFPWSVATEIVNMELVDSSYIKPINKEKSVIFYGDSILNGYDSLYTSNAMFARLAHEFGMESFNKSIGGEVYCPELVHRGSDLSPELIVVAYGTNDWTKKEQPDFVKRCEAFFEHLIHKYPSAHICAITPIWGKDFEEKHNFGSFSDVEKEIKNICSKQGGITVISGWNMVPHSENYYADLRLHPNDKGFECYYNNLKKEIEKIIIK